MTRALLVAHDAGGATILASWAAEHRSEYELACCVDGPAARVFGQTVTLPAAGLDAIEDLGPGDFVLTGSSRDADLERRAIRAARERGRRCVTFLDHYTSYRERFSDQLPDEIWVGDAYAYELARRTFPATAVRQVPNPYFTRLERLAAVRPSPPAGRRLLYLTEPVALRLRLTYGEAAASQYDTELDLLEKFFEAAATARERIDAIVVRTHPREEAGKYDALLSRWAARLPLVASSSGPVEEEILASSMVIGVETIGLVAAVALSRAAVSCVTGKPWPISLPHAEIRRITDFRQLFDGVLT